MNINEKISKVELLALIKQYNRNGIDKIMNVDKMKKEELMELCSKYSLINYEHSKGEVSDMNLKNIPITKLQQDVELFFLCQGKKIPQEVAKMKKKYLIDYMILNTIPHYTTEDLEKKYNEYQIMTRNKNIIIYNIIRYDNVDIENIDNTKLEKYIEDNNLDKNVEHFDAYTVFLRDLYNAYENFRESKGESVATDKMKTFPKILKKINEAFNV